MDEWNDEAILMDLGSRLRRERLNRNISQEALATSAGISVKTLANAESGEGTTLTTIVRILRALGGLDRLDALFPEPQPSPLQLLQRGGSERSRASGSRGDE